MHTPTPSGSDARPERVAMMVWNTCENDSRVIKEATTLASAGYDVTVVCLAGKDLPDLESRSGVTYQRIDRVFRPVRDRVDFFIRLFGTLVLAVAAAIIFVALIAAGWILVPPALTWGAEANRIELALAAVLLFILGLALGPRFKSRRVIARRLVRRVRSLRRSISKRVPFRTRLLLGLYRVLTFRLVYLTMGESVAALGPSVIHAHDLQTLPAGAKLKRRLGAALVYDSHELATHVSTRPPLFLRLWMMWKERRAIRYADRVITVSKGIAEHLQRRYRLQQPVLTLYNSPPTHTSNPSGRTVRGDLGLGDDVPLALYVGALTGNRGLEQTVDTLGLLPEFHLACVGPRRDEWEADMSARAREAGSHDRLHFLDPLPIEQLIDYLSTGDVGIIAIQNITLSYWFTMPNKLFETVLAGVPVVVADLVHLREFVEEHRVGVVADEKDPAALARAVRDVVANPELKPTGARLEQLRQAFGWETQARHLVALYADLLRRTGVPAESE